MRVLLLGATGSIGSAVTAELIRHGYDLTALARSDTSAETLKAQGVGVLRGDIRSPEAWVPAVRNADAVVHMASTFSDDMEAVDTRLTAALLAEIGAAPQPVRLVYTGGCWLFGATGERIANETSPFDPIPAFRWMIDNAAMLDGAANTQAVIVHPAMVYHRDGGVLWRFLDGVRDHGRAEVWGALETRWPVVHRDDLAVLYRLILEHGYPGDSSCAAAEDGVWVGDMAAAVHRRFGIDAEPLVRPTADVMAQHGDWALGPTLDQQMSGAKAMRDLGWQPIHLDIVSEIA
jgi:nucleoside-diphosphate-sugar epimerase